jgi:hypothetical protein
MYAYQTADQSEVICVKCGEKMTYGEVKLSYLGSTFPVSLNKCDRCGTVYIPEDLALGKMAQVERTLEDK